MSSSPEIELAAVDAHKSKVSAGPILAALGLGGVVGFALISNDWISACCVLLVMGATYLGYRKGATKISAGVIGMLFAIRYAAPLANVMAPYCDRLVNLPASLQQLAIQIAAGCLIAILVYSALRLASRLMFQSKPQWKFLDRWLGAGVGLVQGIVIVLLLLLSLMIVEPIAQRQLRHSHEAQSDNLVRHLSVKVVEWSAQVENSSMGALMEAMDPIRIQLDNRVQKMSKEISKEFARCSSCEKIP